MTIPPLVQNSDVSAVTTPQTGNSGASAVSQAAAAYLASKTAAPAAPVTPAAPAAPAASEPGQPRASDGTFAPPLPPDPNAPPAATPGADPAAPDAGQAPPAGDPAAPEGQEAPADAEAAARTVELDLDGDIVDLTLPDPEVAAVVREAVTLAQRLPRIEARMERIEAETAAVREYAEVDPVGFVAEAIGNDLAAQEHLALSLLTKPEVWAKVKDRVARLTDPVQFESEQNRQKAARVDFREQATTRVQESREVAANARDIQHAVATVVRGFNTITPEAQQIAYADMLRDVQRYATKHNLLTVPVSDLPLVLTERLTAYGADPAVVARQMTEAAASRGRRGAPSRAAAPRSMARPVVTPPAPAATPARPATPAMPARPSGRDFVASAERRRTVAAIPGPGAGSPSVPDLALPTNPDGSKMNVEQALAYHRSRVAKGQRVLGPS